MDLSTFDVSGLVSPAVVYALVGGFLVTFITNLIKSKYFVNTNPQWVVLLVTTILGGVYAIFKTFLDVELQEKILDFAWMSLTANVFLYEFIWKNISGQRQGKIDKPE